MRVTVLAGGYGGARFLLGLRELPDLDVTVVANTADDIDVFGLRVCPDLDTIMYTLGGGISTERGWGRADETFVVSEELAHYQVGPSWFGLGDRDIATHLVRTQMRAAGYSLSRITEALCVRWRPGVRLIPMSDDRVETHVIVEIDGDRQAIHFQQWWIAHRAELAAQEFVMIGAPDSAPAPGVLDAIRTADVVVLPPSNPVVSIGAILQVPGIRTALQETSAPVVGVSPIIGDAPVRGMADACLAAISVETTAFGVGAHYGSRTSGGLLDGWLVDDAHDSDAVAKLAREGVQARAVPLFMSDVATSTELARAVLELARDVSR